jgi:hypothetical protein
MGLCQRIYSQSINIGIEGDFAPWVGALVGDVNNLHSLLKLAEEEA